MKIAQVIIGSGFGDEGKGIMTDYFSDLYKSENAVVIRYNGGAQAGHTVVTPDNDRHVFSHFGSGTFVGIPTYLASEFIVNPMLFNKEYMELFKYKPIVYVHGKCRITTPYDILLNQLIEDSRGNKHGSCGLGIFETIIRHKEIPLTVSDFYNKDITYLMDIIFSIKEYAYARLKACDIAITDDIINLLELDIVTPFFQDLNIFCWAVAPDNSPLKTKNVYIFESAQGLLLSEKHGVMPHLTPSDPGLAIPLQICKELDIKNVNVCYVTRCYTTRHGNGPLTDEKPVEEMGLYVQGETNVTNKYQGNFRYAPLDVQAIKTAINNDFKESIGYDGTVTKQLAITCIDQLPQFRQGLIDDILTFMKNVYNSIDMSTGYFSVGPSRNYVHTATLNKR